MVSSYWWFFSTRHVFIYIYIYTLSYCLKFSSTIQHLQYTFEFFSRWYLNLWYYDMSTTPPALFQCHRPLDKNAYIKKHSFGSSRNAFPQRFYLWLKNYFLLLQLLRLASVVNLKVKLKKKQIPNSEANSNGNSLITAKNWNTIRDWQWSVSVFR